MGLLTSIKRHRGKAAIAVVVAALLAVAGYLAVDAKLAPIAWGWYGPVSTHAGLALDGYDPVTYHTEGVARQGSAAHKWTWNDAVWHFASAENRALFQADPLRYAPQFGGYSALAVSDGMTAASDPNVWHFEDGKLYLFAGETPKRDWTARIDTGIIERSEANWARR